MKRVNIDAKVRTFNMHIISIQFLFAVGMIIRHFYILGCYNAILNLYTARSRNETIMSLSLKFTPSRQNKLKF